MPPSKKPEETTTFDPLWGAAVSEVKCHVGVNTPGDTRLSFGTRLGDTCVLHPLGILVQNKHGARFILPMGNCTTIVLA